MSIRNYIKSIDLVYEIVFFFFFQAEDGIRDVAVTGVQTCALPISRGASCGDRICARGSRKLQFIRREAAGVSVLADTSLDCCRSYRLRSILKIRFAAKTAARDRKSVV